MQYIQINSKKIKKGDIFVAISCENCKKNINEALQKKASIVFTEKNNIDLKKTEKNNIIIVNDARLIASKLAKFMYSKQPEVCVAITGTNGKSSTANFLQQIWSNLEKKSANLGTLGLFIDGIIAKPDILKKHYDIEITGLTTPDPINLHKIMVFLKDNDVSHMVFEASSHALDQKRLHSTSLSAAAFCNFDSDHLDYHKTTSKYFASKLKLFKDILPKTNPAIVSLDFPQIYENVAKFNKNIISFGFSKNNLIRASNITEYPDKLIFNLECGNKKFIDIKLNLFGKFQLMNVLCSIALAYSTNFAIEDIVKVLPKLKTFDGRMEHIIKHNNADIYVDYAHTVDGLFQALKCFKNVCKGRLICVFGCGGDRDKSKRSQMGEIANNIADIVIITDDNPRTENPKIIRSEVISKCPKAIEIECRKEAIKYAINIIKPDDFVIILGKGHEKTQIFKDKTIYFNDKEEILNICN